MVHSVLFFDLFFSTLIITFLTGIYLSPRLRKLTDGNKHMEEMLPAKEPSIIEQEMVISRPPKLRQPHPDPYPWLMISNGKRDGHLAFYSILENQYHVRVVPELQGKIICCWNKEWLVLMDDSTHMCSVLNILTEEKVHLPLLNVINWGGYRGMLSLNSDGNRWRVLIFAGPELKILSYHLGDTEFVEHEPDIPYSQYIECSTIFRGDLYVMMWGIYDLFSANLSNRHLDFTLVVDGVSLDKVVRKGEKKYNLVESCGQLLLVIMSFVNNVVSGIDIFRADFDVGEWVKSDGIGDGAILVDEASTRGHCYENAATLCLKPNSIYYILQERRTLFIYDIEDQSISMSLPCDIVDFSSRLSWMFI